jgi:AcrR family transcriptional regulator
MPVRALKPRKSSDTRDALLKAATVLFADRGLDAVSVRDITNAAGANIGAITYYFGSKEELIKEVYRVAIAPRRELRLAALDRYERSVGSGKTAPEGVLRALVEATIRTALEPDGEASYAMRLVFQAYALRRPMLDEVITEQLDQFAARFIAALARSMPELSLEEVGWRYYFTIGATLHIAFDSQRSSRLRRLTGGLCDTSDPDRMVEQLLDFLMGGIRGRRHAPSGRLTAVGGEAADARQNATARETRT